MTNNEEPVPAAPAGARRTKRRYAHELYPHPDDSYETRPLEVDVPYLYARAIGLEVWGTGWFDLLGADRVATERTSLLISTRHIAFAADALLQGLTGQGAWEWISQRYGDETGEWAFDRAVHYGVNPDLIKPYPCGPEPTHHEHLGERDNHVSVVTRVDGPESTCPDCTEPINPDAALAADQQ